ncbi:MAG TPA: hypothetical protein VM347_34085 [Nonomuraea sp.]|nr:hypothetical protein [Nonomuraea sp.]
MSSAVIEVRDLPRRRHTLETVGVLGVLGVLGAWSVAGSLMQMRRDRALQRIG